MIKKLLFLGLLLCGGITLQAVVAVGDTADASTTFQFSVGSAIYDAVNSRLWTLSGEDISSLDADIQEYGISYTDFIAVDGSLGITLTTYPYLTTNAVVTTTDGDGNLVTPGDQVDNPLLGQAYSAVTFLGTYLTVVNSLTPRYVYMIQSSTFYDGKALGKNSPEGISIINLLDLGLTYEAKVIAGSGMGVLFIAQAQGTFGTDNSYLSFAATQVTNVATTNTTVAYTTVVKQADEAITVATPVLTAGGADVVSIGTSVALYPSATTTLNMCVGLDVTADSGSGDQAVGMFTALANVVTGSTPASITFNSVIPDAVAGAGLQTPISAIEGSRVVVSNITTTRTSTGLSYYVTTRYDGSGRQNVYAMPMVTTATTSSNNGMVASYDSISQTFKIIGAEYRVQGFDTVIADANEIDIEGSVEVIARLQVGGDSVPLAAGVLIDQLTAQGDAVYITIQEAFGTLSTPGMFKSQALFDDQGRIMSWSPWQRVAGTDDQMLFAVKNRTTDATMYVSGADSDTIQQSVWNNSTDLTTLISAINAATPTTNGGVQGLIPVSNQTTDLSDFPLVVATGNLGVVIAQTGSINSFGSIQIDSPQNTVTLDSSLSLDIGSVVTATFAHDSGTGNNWFFMGGSNGLSVLSDDTTGYAFNGELTSLSTLTASGMSCKTLGNFSFVKKVVSDSNFLYVLTPSAVYQIALDADKFVATSPVDLDAQVVVQASTINGFASCTDMLVDTNVMLLGTTAGLYSLDLSGGLPATPVTITVSGGLSSVSRLTVVSNNANSDQKFYDSSNLYVLTINYAVQQARLNRFTISSGVVTPIQDQLLSGQNGPLLIFDYMMNNIFIDGSFGFATSYRIGSVKPITKYMEFTLQAGKSSSQVLLNTATANLSISTVVNSLGITAIARDYASGCLMLAGSFGLLADS
ncbi:MAG: hypothetical protein Q8Q60_00480 [Candidatus Chromulinivorax sp.]|nr:hypothetical protein [Candidatus Chromulinivorax sp.]